MRISDWSSDVCSSDLETDRAHIGTQEGPVEQGILSLVEIRASQLNGCAFCLDMHIKQARLHGERELRLHHVAIGRESTLFSDRERAALEWKIGRASCRERVCKYG